MILASSRASESSMLQTTGRMGHGHAVLAAREDRAFVEAEPVHVHLPTQYSRHSRMNFCTIGWLQLTVLPQPE